MRAILALLFFVLSPIAAHASDRVVSETGLARAAVGWFQFCANHPRDCRPDRKPRDVVLTQRAWSDLVAVNRWVNEKIEPLSDMDHWGIQEKWSYPDDGYGDCEDYVLLKRRMLIEGGWPRSALLITVVRDKKDEGHAVLLVKTDKGDLILDNFTDDILWPRETGYTFVKRQSQRDPNVWVALQAVPPAPPPVAKLPQRRGAAVSVR